MPYKSEKIKLNETQDRRRKITSDQRELIRKLYSTGYYTMTALGKEFGVSRYLVSIIVNPSRAEKVSQRVKEHWRDYRPSNESWAATQREHRKYKHELYKKGELK